MSSIWIVGYEHEFDSDTRINLVCSYAKKETAIAAKDGWEKSYQLFQACIKLLNYTRLKKYEEVRSKLIELGVAKEHLQGFGCRDWDGDWNTFCDIDGRCYFVQELELVN